MNPWINRAVYRYGKITALMLAIDKSLKGWNGKIEGKGLSALSKRFGVPVGAIESVVHLAIARKVMGVGTRLAKITQLMAEHQRDGIRAVCQRYDLPPWRTLVYLYPDVKYGAPDDLKADVEWALHNDADSPLVYADMQARAEAFEREMASWLDSIGIRYRSQSDLVAEQIVTHGRAVATPDFLLEAPMDITVGGREYIVHWFDCKNYLLTDVHFIVSSARRQAEKYNALFGSGAFVYRWGFSEGIRLPCLLLDWSGRPKLK